MTLLLDKTCVHCKKVEEMSGLFSDIVKLYVVNGMIQLDGIEYPLDKKIPVLPALIVGNDNDCKVYCGEKYITDFLNTLSQEKK